MSPTCDPLFQALASEQTAYRAAVDALLAGPFAEETLKAKLEEHAAFIEQALASDAKGPGSSAWRAAVAALAQRI